MAGLSQAAWMAALPHDRSSGTCKTHLLAQSFWPMSVLAGGEPSSSSKRWSPVAASQRVGHSPSVLALTVGQHQVVASCPKVGRTRYPNTHDHFGIEAGSHPVTKQSELRPLSHTQSPT